MNFYTNLETTTFFRLHVTIVSNATSLYTQNKSFAETKALWAGGPTDGQTDGHTLL